MAGSLNTLVIGIGNPYRSDDAVGLHVARQLQGRLPEGTQIIECTGETTELMEAWNGAERVIIVDALCSGGTSGGIQRIDASRDTLPANLKQTSTHAFGLAEAIELARVLKTLPDVVVIFGIEGENFEHGQTLSPAARESIDACCELVAAEV